MYLSRGVGKVFLCQSFPLLSIISESKQVLRLGVGCCLLGESRSLSPEVHTEAGFCEQSQFHENNSFTFINNRDY